MIHLSHLVSRLNVLKQFSCNTTSLVLAVLDRLQSEGFLTFNYSPFNKTLSITSSVISSIRLISKPSRRIYVYPNTIPSHSGFGCYLILTPKGILTDFEAKKFNLGGELLLFVN